MKTFKLHSLWILLALFIIGCKPGEDPITVTVQNLSITIDENPSAGQILGMITSTTSKGSVTFTITSQAPAGAFAINAISGELTVANASLFDFEANPTLTAVITATNGAISATGNVTVTLNNVPDAVNAQDATIAMDENPLAAAHITDISATNDAGTLSYTISSQVPAGSFSLDGTTGEVTVADETKFDFETNPTLSIVVTASNGTVSDDATITVNLNNVLETLTTQDESVTIDENPSNGQAIVTVTSTTDAGAASFAIINESVAGAFAIDMTSGAVTVADPSLFDFEQRTSLTATVNVTNGSLTATAIVTVNLNDVFELAWTQVSANAAFGERYGHGFVSFNNKLWVIGGIKGTTRTNEIWSSSDGVNWQQEQTTGNVFPPINNFATLVYDNKIWVVAGFTDNGRTHDIWSSPDGVAWTRVVTPVVFTIRSDTQIAYYNAKAWVIGGLNHSGTPTAEIFNSDDLATWTGQGFANIQGGVAGHQMVVFNNKMWILGGSSQDSQQLLVQQNGIWSSSDGVNWTKEVINGALFDPRWLHRAIVFNNRLYVIGGESEGTRNNEVWSSIDGVNWTKEANSPFAERDNFGLVEFNGQMWMTGGSNSNGVLSDVWRSN